MTTRSNKSMAHLAPCWDWIRSLSLIKPISSPKQRRRAPGSSSDAAAGAIARLSSAATTRQFANQNFSILQPTQPKFAPSSFTLIGHAAAWAREFSKLANPPPAPLASRVSKWVPRSPAFRCISSAAIRSSNVSKCLSATAPLFPLFEWPSPIPSESREILQPTRSASRTQLRARKLTRPCVRSIEGNDPSSYALCGVHAFPRFHGADTPPALPPSDANRSRGILLLFASVQSTRAARPPASTLAHHAAAESPPTSPHPSGASHCFALCFRAAPAFCRWPACVFS